MKAGSKQHCEFLRHQGKTIFNQIRGTWCDLLRWTMPYKASWILSQTPGERKNQHIVDPSHLFAMRSCVAGFSEGNTSATRPWYRAGTRDSDTNDSYKAKEWLQHLTRRTLSYLQSSNYYDAATIFYYDFHAVNTGAHYFQELENGGFHVHTLIPGSYYVINDGFGVASILIREFCLNVKSVVDQYGKKNKSGLRDWSNISKNVRKMYEDGNYTQKVDIVHIIMENPDYDISNPNSPMNRKWLELTYEMGGGQGNHNYNGDAEFGDEGGWLKDEVFLKRHTTKRKPFVVGKSTSTFEYGETGPTLDALGLIKSLNKKAIGKDQALEQMLNPTLQGPASLKKSYVNTNPNTYVPLDSRTMASKGKLESIFNISPAIGAVVQDVNELRQMVDKAYYVDYLLYLSQNPKTRTAAETNAIVEEQQRVIGPALLALNTTYNNPVIEWVMDYVLFEDPYLEPPPSELEGQALKPEMVSVFAQAQRAADLPSIDRYVAMISQVAQLDPRVLQKANLDKLADLYEDRLYLPSGLNNPQDKVDAMREQAQMQAQRDAMLQQTLPAVAKSAKDMSAAQSNMSQQ